MTADEITQLRTMRWVECREPMRDALLAFAPEGVEFPLELIPPSREQRWYPEEGGGCRLLVPYDGGSYNADVFQFAAGAWDHNTCDVCVTRIPAMDLCYVTEGEPYLRLCSGCYKEYVSQ